MLVVAMLSLMMCTVQLASDGMIYIASFMKTVWDT
jgi:hypothetical protein